MKWIERLVNFFSTSHQRKLLLLVTVVVTLVMSAFGTYLVNNQGQIASAELEGRATRTANLLAQTTAISLLSLDNANLEAQIRAVMADPEVQTVNIYEKGKSQPLVTNSRDIAAVDPITRRAEIVLQHGATITPLGNLEIIYSRENLNRSINQLQLLLVTIILALTFLLGASLYFLEARLVTRPLHEITALTSRISVGDFTGRANLTSRDEIGVLASAFNSMTNQLQQTLEELEQRVQIRTTEVEQKSIQLENRAIQFQAIADISRDLAAINDFDELLPAIVRLIGERFGLYHVGIYLMNAAKDTIILSAASGAGSQSLLEQNFSLPVEPSSMSGYAASRGQPRVALDVERDSTYLALSELPETKSEAALPLLAGTETIGVLDLQSINPKTFGGDDLSFLSTLANQVALSILNARSFSATQQALLESEKIYEQYVQQGWKRISRETPNLGYRYSQAGVTPLKLAAESSKTGETTSTPEAAAASQQDRATLLSIPIKLRGQTIGTMEILSTELARALDSDEMAMIQATAERAALALETARLLEDSQRRASRERAIGEISTSISSAVDIDTILRTTVDELGKKLKNAEISIHVGSEQETL